MDISSHSSQEFQPRWPWIGPDLQTLRNRFCRRRRARWRRDISDAAHLETVPLPHSPGDGIRIAVNRPAGEYTGKPAVLLIHGLTGCETSDNVLNSTRMLLMRGHPVFRMNLRGSGPGALVSRSMYHGGLTADLRCVVRRLRKSVLAEAGLNAMAFSLGANLLLKYLGETGGDSGLDAAVGVSAPIDLRAAQQRIEKPRNRIYHHALLKDMLAGVRRLPAMMEGVGPQVLDRMRRIYDFDNIFIAARHGYRDAAHYYAENSARRFLGAVRTPALMIHARDDPWIPKESYEGLPDNPALRLLLPAGGGHVGFHGRGNRQPWHDLKALSFFESLSR